jgi:hypothetical protein
VVIEATHILLRYRPPESHSITLRLYVYAISAPKRPICRAPSTLKVYHPRLPCGYDDHDQIFLTRPSRYCPATYGRPSRGSGHMIHVMKFLRTKHNLIRQQTNKIMWLKFRILEGFQVTIHPPFVPSHLTFHRPSTSSLELASVGPCDASTIIPLLRPQSLAELRLPCTSLVHSEENRLLATL